MNDEQMHTNSEDPKSSGIWLVILVIFLIIVAIVGVYYYQQLNKTTNPKTTTGPIYTTASTQAVTSASQSPTSSSTSSSTSTTGQIFTNDKFSYTCPVDWTLGTNKNYNGQVDLSECSKIYSGKMSFDDGIDMTFGYVPQTVADSIDGATGQKYADTILNQVKNETNAQSYTNNNFTGYLSGQTNTHTLALIARYPVAGGYYEVSATAMGNTQTSQQYEQMVNDVISTFKTK